MLVTKIEAQAHKALTDDNFVRKAGMCQKLVRQVVQKVAGAKFNRYFKGTANATAKAFLNSPYVVRNAGDGQPGDLLYWFGTPGQTAGHAAIRVKGNKIVHNSITDLHDKKTGSKGYKDLRNMRAPDLVVRLRD